MLYILARGKSQHATGPVMKRKRGFAVAVAVGEGRLYNQLYLTFLLRVGTLIVATGASLSRQTTRVEMGNYDTTTVGLQLQPCKSNQGSVGKGRGMI